MNRLSIKFIGGSLVMFILTIGYDFFALFRVIITQIGFYSLTDKLLFFEAWKFSPIFNAVALFLDFFIVLLLAIFLWYFTIRFLMIPSTRYVISFLIIFLVAVFYYLIPSLVFPKDFCSSYGNAVTCPSFCENIGSTTLIPEDFGSCKNRW